MIHTSEHSKYTSKPERCKNLPSCSGGLFAARVRLLGSLHNLIEPLRGKRCMFLNFIVKINSTGLA